MLPQPNSLPPFILLTLYNGEALLLATTHILSVVPLEVEKGASHREMDPDCHCEDCRPEATEYRSWWSKSSVELDTIEGTCEEHGVERTSYDVRETVREIAEIIGMTNSHAVAP